MNNFNNNWGYNNGYNMNGYMYNRPKMPSPTNPLSKEDMALLMQKAPQFSLAISQVDALKAICTHRDKEGDKLIRNNDGTVTCTICGTTFRPVNTDADSVKKVFQQAVDCLETIKIMYMDIPDDVTRAYFQMTPFLQKGPQLYEIALDHYNRYSGGSNVVAGNFNNGMNAFNMWSMMMNPGAAMGMGMPQQMPYGQPGMAQPGASPIPDVTMGGMDGVNPFDSSSPAMDAAKTVTDNKQYSL